MSICLVFIQTFHLKSKSSEWDLSSGDDECLQNLLAIYLTVIDIFRFGPKYWTARQTDTALLPARLHILISPEKFTFPW